MLRTSSALKLGKSRRLAARLAREVRNNPQSMYQSRCQCGVCRQPIPTCAVCGAPAPRATACAGRGDVATAAQDSAEPQAQDKLECHVVGVPVARSGLLVTPPADFSPGRPPEVGWSQASRVYHCRTPCTWASNGPPVTCRCRERPRILLDGIDGNDSFPATAPRGLCS